MGKPYGMTASFQIIRPTVVDDKVYDAVEAAVDAGWTVNRFLEEAREDWRSYLKQKAEWDDKDFKEAKSDE